MVWRRNEKYYRLGTKKWLGVLKKGLFVRLSSKVI